ncbi:pyridoxamine 5'-phosphate oxidase family protein [Microlunatus speluncae]|uniref:pyridoxamine 5'-phosphate oxidase family protein n=1 Tax=Microlunatus speluncae TaxID=2594267 RepID=UPI00126658F5|nr:pyridoxamine 5'-phosphate oxidase family protein [Microlunatus speluncae]
MGNNASTTGPKGRPGRLPDGYNQRGEQRPLAWPDVRQRLEQAKHFWFSTADADGAPHARPIWAAWVDNTLYADGGVQVTRWGRDLLANPRIQVHLESALDVVIVDGTFTLENDLTAEAFGRVQASYLERYKDYQPESANGLFMIKPRQVLAWSQFPVDVTSFTFD